MDVDISASDDRKYQALVLPNGLRVMLVSDASLEPPCCIYIKCENLYDARARARLCSSVEEESPNARFDAQARTKRPRR